MPTIRPETPDDAEAIARVHVRAWQGGYAGLIPAEVLSRLNPAAWAQRRRDMGTADPEQPFTTLVAIDDAGSRRLRHLRAVPRSTRTATTSTSGTARSSACTSTPAPGATASARR